MNKLEIIELKQKRMDLIEEYYYWMSRSDCDEDILEDIESEIVSIEKLLGDKC